jgi:pimeloyl-ACP methyl ester carboxylesterase
MAHNSDHEVKEAAVTKPHMEKRNQATVGDPRSRLLAGVPVTERRLQVAGVSTAVLECGDGPPIVLLHGQGGFAALWLSAIPGLAATHRVIAPDLPGLGASEAPNGPPGAETVLAWLGELIDQTCPTPPVLVGLSIGGQIAARFAAEHSERLDRLVLVDTPGLVGRVRPAPRTLLALIRHSARPSERSTLRMLRHLVVDLERLRRQLDKRWAPFLAYMVDRALTPSVKQANRRLMRELGLQQIPPQDVGRISAQTTLIWGRADRVTPLRTAEVASSRYGWRLHVIDDAGHLSLAEQPQAFLRALRTALDNAQPKGTSRP